MAGRKSIEEKIYIVLAKATVTLLVNDQEGAITQLEELLSPEFMEKDGAEVIREEGKIAVQMKGSKSPLMGPEVGKSKFKVHSDGPMHLIQAALLARREGLIEKEAGLNIALNTMMYMGKVLAAKTLQEQMQQAEGPEGVQFRMIESIDPKAL